MAQEVPIEVEGDETTKLTNGTPENGPGNMKTPFTNGVIPENGPGNTPKKKRFVVDSYVKGRACQQFKNKKFLIGIVILALFIAIIALAVYFLARKAPQYPSDGCFHGWSQHGDWSYFFSDEERDWYFSYSNCSSCHASLVMMDSNKEWDLVKSKKDEFWTGFKRENTEQPWTWPNGSHVDQIKIKGSGNCSYTNGDIISSTYCDNNRRWICRRPVHARNVKHVQVVRYLPDAESCSTGSQQSH